MTTRRETVRRPVAARRPMTWDNKVFTLSHAAGGSTIINDLSHVMIRLNAEPQGTCVRMIGHMSLWADSATPDAEDYGVGICVISADAAAAAVVPDPLADENQDWYYWWAGRPPVSTAGFQRDFDIHSARKLRGGYRLVLVSEKGVGEVALEATFSIRTLWKLP